MSQSKERCRLRKRCGRSRDNTMADLLLRSGASVVAETALVERFGSIEKAISAPMKELCTVDGMTENSAVFLGLLSELRRRLARNAELPTMTDDGKDVKRYFARKFSVAVSEESYALIVSKKGKGKRVLKLGHGDASAAPFEVEEVENGTPLAKEDMAVVVHNHIEKIKQPSLDDFGAAKAGADQGVAVGDRLIVYGGSGSPVINYDGKRGKKEV